MQSIQQLADRIDGELRDAERYIIDAITAGDDDRDIADGYARLSEEEMGHVKLLHDLATRKIAEYKADHGDPPADMLERWSARHEKHTRRADTIKALQDVYKKR